MLHGLKRAALSGESYDAVSRAKNLKATDRASIDAFCNATRQIFENEESAKLSSTAYFISRIEGDAERELDFVSTKPVHAAVEELNALYDLASFNTSSLRRYAKACFH